MKYTCRKTSMWTQN